MKIEIKALGEMQTNCYLVYNEKTKEGWITDPGADPQTVLQILNKLSIKPKAILLTHGHFDHIMAVNELKKRLDIPVFAHRDEAKLLADARANLSALWAQPYVVEPDCLLEDNQKLSLAGYEITVLQTPGHTKGSVCYYIEQENVLLSGDTLFCESYGRTDFEGGSFSQMRSSIRRLLKLPDQTFVYPGHGEASTIGHERLYNPAAE